VVAPECEQRRGGIDGADDQQDDPEGEIEDELGEVDGSDAGCMSERPQDTSRNVEV